MRCPKCQYISFGSASRCRNCGYDFSLSEEPPATDLPIRRSDEPVGPLKDLPLAIESSRPVNAPVLTGPGAASRLDLPLFAGGAAPEDAPLITPPAAPRAPLSVRKTSPAHPRARAVPEELFEQNQVSARTRRPPAGRPHELFPSETPDEPEHAPAITPESTGGPRPAPPALRLAAGLIDLLIMGSIDLTVVYLTLRFSGLTSADLAILPKIPLGAFLALLNGGYLVLFTVASGQTIGKMLSGVRVMSLPPGGAPARVSFGTAIVRAAAYLASLLPAGLGLLPILLSPDRRALHDRLAGTCVVKA